MKQKQGYIKIPFTFGTIFIQYNTYKNTNANEACVVVQSLQSPLFLERQFDKMTLHYYITLCIIHADKAAYITVESTLGSHDRKRCPALTSAKDYSHLWSVLQTQS